jgi:Zn finger protein HypA/HybF involved in hydrogenase expression
MNTVKMKVPVRNSTDSILAALIVSIKTEMKQAYEEQLSALKQIGAESDDLEELKSATELISEALDKQFKPKRITRTNKTAICPTCHHRVTNNHHSYCHRCGQKLIPPRWLE